MPIVKCFVDSTNRTAPDTSTSPAVKYYYPKAAEVHRDGERAVDSASFVFSGDASIKNNDQITYIQDLVDTTYLKAIYNFQDGGNWTTAKGAPFSSNLAIKDEAGYMIDGYSTNLTSRYSYETATGVGMMSYGTRVFLTANAGDHVIFPTVSYSGSPVLDFSGQFDIFMWVYMDIGNNTTRTLLSRYDNTAVVGIEIKVDATGHILVNLNNVTQITGTTNLLDNKYHIIRITRDVNNDIKAYNNGVQEGSTFNSTTSYNPATPPSLVLAQNFNQSGTIFIGRWCQLRIYCGGSLSSTDATTLLQTKPQPQTMKIGGAVSKIIDGLDNKTVYMKSFGQILINTIIRQTTSAESPASFNPIYSSKTPVQILSDSTVGILPNFFSDWTFIWAATGASSDGSNSMTRYVASNNFQTNLIFLVLSSGSQTSTFATFHSDARKTLTIEDSDLDHSFGSLKPGGIRFVSNILGGKYDIDDSGKDTTYTINDLEIRGIIDLYHKSELKSGDGATTAFTLLQQPYNLRVMVGTNPFTLQPYTQVNSAPGASQYTVDFESKTITFGVAPPNAANNIGIEYDFENATSSAFGTSTGLYWRNSDATSITNNGRYSKSIIAPGLKSLTDIRNMVANFISRNKNVNIRYTLISPIHLNTIRENFKVSLVNPTKGIGTLTSPINTTIKAITWYYPSMKTVVNMGEHNFDSFDLDNLMSDKMTQSDSTYGKTKAP